MSVDPHHGVGGDLISNSPGRNSQPLNLEVLGDIQEGVDLLEADDNLTLVDELDNVLQSRELNTSEVNKRLGLRVTQEDVWLQY